MAADNGSDSEFAVLIIITIILFLAGLWPLGASLGLFLISRNLLNRIGR